MPRQITLETQKVSARERLQRLRNVREMASSLYKSIIAECDIAQAQLAGIERTVAESEKRCEALEQMVTWDGDQPDFWSLDGKIWKRATAANVGKLVRVNNRASCKPTESPEAKLIGIAHGWMCCEGSKGQIVEWKYAWIESNPCEEAEQADDDGKGYISIQVGAFYPGEPSLPVVKEDLKTEPAPTVNESLTVEPPFKPGDFVRIAKPGPTEISSKAWFPSMEGFDGAVRRVSKCNTENRSCTLETCGDYVFPFSWLTKIEG
jgi:hypothetical protein